MTSYLREVAAIAARLEALGISVNIRLVGHGFSVQTSYVWRTTKRIVTFEGMELRFNQMKQVLEHSIWTLELEPGLRRKALATFELPSGTAGQADQQPSGCPTASPAHSRISSRA